MKYILRSFIKLVMILQLMGGFQQAIAMGAGFEPYFQLAKKKQDKITVKEFIAWYERFWDTHKDQYIEFVTKEYTRQLKLLDATELSPQELAKNAFERERSLYARTNVINPITPAQLPEKIRDLVMYFPPSPFEPEFRTQLWQWLQNQ